MIELDPPLDGLRAICARCRRLVPPGSPCELDGAEVYELRTVEQRERMLLAIFGPLADREAKVRGRRVVTSHRAVLGGISFVSGFVAAAQISGEPVITYAIAAGAGLLGALTVRPQPLILLPGSAAQLPPWPRLGAGRIVAGVEPIVAPGSAVPCVAWALALQNHGSWGSHTTLRAGATLGFTVELDGGDRVRVPAGPLWIDGPLAQVDGEDSLVDELLEAVDPHAAASPWKLFPFNTISEQRLHEGDRIEVLGAVEPRPVSDAATLYRESPPTELVHPGLPIVRRT